MPQSRSMVDWNFDKIATPEVSIPVRKNRQTLKRKPRGPFGIRKSKPLVEYSERHFLVSGKKIKKSHSIKIRKAKRDSFGNVLNSAK